MPIKQFGLKDFSPKSRDAVALQQIKERGALPMIDRGDIRQAICGRCNNIWSYTWALVVGLTWSVAWLQNSKKRAERSEIDVWAGSAAVISALVICIIVCLSWAVNHYRDNAITYKAQRDKNARELKLANRGNYWHARIRQRVATLDAKYTKELADAKAENDALRDDERRAGRRRLHIKQSVSQYIEATTASGVDNATSPTGRHLVGLFTSKADHYAKNNWKEQKYVNKRSEWSCPYRWAARWY